MQYQQTYFTEAMDCTAQDLLIIYEKEAQQWATYLQSVVSGPIPNEGICCYDIGTVSGKQDDFFRLGQFTCKLLILSKSMLEGLCQMRRFFLARVLSPASHVVVLLCGVESLKPLLEMVHLNGDQCLQISSEQEPHEYLSAVTDILKKGPNVKPVTRKSSGGEQKMDKMKPASGHIGSTIMLIPPRVPCGCSLDVFVLLKNKSAGTVTEVEFVKDNQMFQVKPTQWSDSVLCVNAPDFPAGIVKVTVLCDKVALNNTVLLYYNVMEEMSCLLSKAADPVEFMCQALQVSSVEKLDQTLSSMLLKGMPSGGFQGLRWRGTPERENHHSEVPTMLHFAALYGLKNLSSVLIQCPGAERAVRTANQHGHTPIEIARDHGHAELHLFLKEMLRMIHPEKDNGDPSVYETMCTAGSASTANTQKEQRESDKEKDEDHYAAFGLRDVYDSTEMSTRAVAIANRPPAPTPRPETTMNVIKAFQKRMNPGETKLYSLPTKEAQGLEDNTSPTYDTFVASQTLGLQQLSQLPQRVRAKSLTTEEASDRLNDWQRVQKGAIQQGKSSQQQATIINNKVDDSVYDKINIVHHTPSAVVNESRRSSQSEKSDFYSKPLKGLHGNFFWKADKR